MVISPSQITTHLKQPKNVAKHALREGVLVSVSKNTRKSYITQKKRVRVDVFIA